MNFADRDRWMRRLYDNPDPSFTPATIAVGLRLALYLRIDTGQLDPKIECLARGRVCRRSVLDAINKLERVGWIEITRVKYSPNQYRLLMPQGANPAHESANFAPVPDANPAPDTGANPAPKNLSVNKGNVASQSKISGAVAPGANFAPETPNPDLLGTPSNTSDDEPAYQSEDGKVLITSAAVTKLYAKFPALAEADDFDLIGYIRNIDVAKCNARASLPERKDAIMRKLKYSNAKRIKAMSEGPKPVIVREIKPKPRKEVYGVDYF